MTTSDLIIKAIKFAEKAHCGQLDDDNKNYFDTHLMPVMQILSVLTDDHVTLCAAILHDTLEDTKTTYNELVLEFGTEIADLVNELTHDGKNDSKGYYFPRLRSEKAIMIKFADRLSNLSRMSSWPKKRREQYLRKSKFWASE